MQVWFHRRQVSAKLPRLLGAVLAISIGLMIPARGRCMSHITYRPARVMSHAVTRHNQLDLSDGVPDSLFDHVVYEPALLRMADFQGEPVSPVSVVPLFSSSPPLPYRLIHRKCLPPHSADPDPFDLLA